MCALSAKNGLNAISSRFFISLAALAKPVDYLIIVPIVLGAIPAAFASSVSICIARA